MSFSSLWGARTIMPTGNSCSNWQTKGSSRLTHAEGSRFLAGQRNSGLLKTVGFLTAGRCKFTMNRVERCSENPTLLNRPTRESDSYLHNSQKFDSCDVYDIFMRERVLFSLCSG